MPKKPATLRQVPYTPGWAILVEDQGETVHTVEYQGHTSGSRTRQNKSMAIDRAQDWAEAHGYFIPDSAIDNLW